MNIITRCYFHNVQAHYKSTDIDTENNTKNNVPNIDISHLIPTIFKQTDQLFLKHLSPAETASGATAAVVIIHNSKIYTSHIGDSRIMLFSKIKTNIYNSSDHKVTTPSEKTRIEKAGGYVSYGRITQPGTYGGLAVARAFGDFQYKKI